MNTSHQISPWKWIALISPDIHADSIRAKELENTAAPAFVTAPTKDQETRNRKAAAVCLDAYREAFHLSEIEAKSIAGLVPKRQLLVKHPDLAKILNLNVVEGARA